MKDLRDLLISASASCSVREVAVTRGVRITSRCVRVPLCSFCNYPNDPPGAPSVEDILRQAGELLAKGAKGITLVSGWLGYRNETAVPYLRAIKREMPCLRVSGAFGPISRESLAALKEAGLDNYSCNLEAAPGVLLRIKGRNDIPERLETLKNARDVGLGVSTGFIIGVGESEGQLMELLTLVRGVDPESVFMTPFEAYPNTPMENCPIPSLAQIVETVAKTRLELEGKTLGIRIVRRGSLIPMEFLSLLVFAGVGMVAPPPGRTDMSAEGFRGLLQSCVRDPEGTGQDLLGRNVDRGDSRDFLEIVRALHP